MKLNVYYCYFVCKALLQGVTLTVFALYLYMDTTWNGASRRGSAMSQWTTMPPQLSVLIDVAMFIVYNLK